MRGPCRFCVVRRSDSQKEVARRSRSSTFRERPSSMKKMTTNNVARLGLAVAIGLPGIGLVAWFWIIPSVIVAAIRERHEGYVAISGWWINGSSAGVTGLALHEEPTPGSPTWAAVDRV